MLTLSLNNFFYIKKRLFLNITTCLIFVLLMLCMLFIAAKAYLGVHNKLEYTKTIVIPQGSSVKTIALQLGKEEIIRYPLLFNLILELSSSQYKLKAGEYAFTPHITPRQVIKILVSGKSIVRKLFIPEGLTTKQILDKINDEATLLGEITETFKEGELMPNTYFFSYGDTKQVILNRMRNKMTQTLDSLWEKRSKGLPIKTKEEALILASIIEKETSINNERRKVAAVFVNRLKKNMKLQADPTVIYAVTKGQENFGRAITRKDLKTESEYNTYFIKGLPPSPISNPSKESIEAALNPEKNNYIFFVANGKGGHNFASTLKQHNRYVNAYRARTNRLIASK